MRFQTWPRIWGRLKVTFLSWCRPPGSKSLCKFLCRNDIKNDCCAAWSDARAEALVQVETGSQATEFQFAKPPPDSDVLTVPLGGGNLATVAHPDKRTYSKLHLGPVGAGRPARDLDLRGEFAKRFNLKYSNLNAQHCFQQVFFTQKSLPILSEPRLTVIFMVLNRLMIFAYL